MPIYRITLITALMAMLGAFGLAIGLATADNSAHGFEYSDVRGVMDGNR